MYTVRYSLYYFAGLLKFTDVRVYGGAVENLCSISLSIMYTSYPG
jgi:hypothetical protein